MRILKTAIIGFGTSGRVFHAPILLNIEGFSLQKIYTNNQTAQAFIDENYPNTSVVKDVNEVFDDEAIDLIIIASPNETHFELAKKGLEKGKHVLVEKPLTPNLLEAIQLETLAKQVGKVLTVYHNRRFDSDFLTLKKVINDGALGRIVEVEAHFDRFRNVLKGSWREKDYQGSGILYDLGSHLIDQALHLFGRPQAIFADIRNQRQLGSVDDAFELILYYEDLKVSLKAGMLVGGPLPKYIVHGLNGSFIKYGSDPQERKLKKGMAPNDLSWGEEDEKDYGKLYLQDDRGHQVVKTIKSERGDYRFFYKNLYEAICFGKKSLIPAHEGRQVIELIELAFKSHEEGRILPIANKA